MLANAQQINYISRRRDAALTAEAVRSANIASKAIVKRTNKWSGSNKPDMYDPHKPIVEWLNPHMTGLKSQSV
jgi:hypothetical protein